jgi:hypothetical protein
MPGNWLIIKSLNESVTNKDKPYDPPQTHTLTHTHPPLVSFTAILL